MKNAQSQRGLTLTEVTVVTVIAAVVLIGISGFYLSSQATWLEASTQAMTQREATTVIEHLTASIRAARIADTPTPGGDELFLYPYAGAPASHHFWLEERMLYETDPLGERRQLLVTSEADSFSVVENDTLVSVRLQLRSSNGQVIVMPSAALLYNR